VDNWDLAKAELATHGIDLDALYQATDAVTIESGRQGHGKLVYAMPFGLVLPSKKLIADIDGIKTNYLDFRCATKDNLTVQDVLPSSIHPETQQPYRWGGRGHWSRLPQIPQELLVVWTNLLTQDKQRNIPTNTNIDASWDEIIAALKFLSPDIDREDWIKVGMALHFAGTATDQQEQAFEVWNEWSAGSAEKYKGTKDLWHSWKGFKPDGGISIGTLFQMAKDHGWRRPVPSAEEIFGKAEEPKVKMLQDATIGTRAPIPQIDLNCFPKILAQRAEEMSESIGCDPLVPLFAGLAVASGTAHAKIRLELMPGYQVPPVLWIMTLGKPADKKTPASSPMATAIRELEREDLPRFRKDKLAWDAQKAVYDAAYKAHIDHHVNMEAQLANDMAPEVPELPAEPAPLQIMVQDVTSQKLARVAAEQNRGVLCWMDEMAGWVERICNPRIEDRSTWTQAYEAGFHIVSRVGAGNIPVDVHAVSIYGNMQPAVFRSKARDLGKDGLIQRFIPGILNSHLSRLNHPIPDVFSCKDLWDQTIRMIHTLPPTTYRLSPEAYTVYRDFQKWFYDTKKDEEILDTGDDTQDNFMTAYGKMEGQVGRLALVFHLIEAPFATEVSGELMQRVVDMVKFYVVPALRYLFGEVTGMLEDSIELYISQYVLSVSGTQQTVTLREIKRSARRKLEKMSLLPNTQKDNMILDAMDFLEKSHWVQKVDANPVRGHHEWAINPALAIQFKEERETVLKARQNRLDWTVEQMARHAGKEIPRQTVKGYDLD
jgi:hypothetical protein